MLDETCIYCDGRGYHFYYQHPDKRVPGTPDNVLIPCTGCNGNGVVPAISKTVVVLLAALLSFLLLGAGAPKLKVVTDVDKEVNAFLLTDVKAPSYVFHRSRLISALNRVQAKLQVGGKQKESQSVYERVLVLRSLDVDKPWASKLQIKDTLRRASQDGKYNVLRCVIYFPEDVKVYTEFNDFGEWQGNQFAGQQVPHASFWVYVYPRWYLWQDRDVRFENVP